MTYVVDPPLQGGWTALIWAARNGLESTVQALLEAGADKDAQNEVTCWFPQGLTCSHPSCVRSPLMLNNPLVSQDGDTALIKASWKGYEVLVKLLVKAGANRTIKAKKGTTALTCAKTEAIKAILRS